MPNVLIHSIEKTSRDIILDTIHGAAYESAAALRLVGYIGLIGATIAVVASRQMSREPALPMSYSKELAHHRRTQSVAFLEDAGATPLLRFKSD